MSGRPRRSTGLQAALQAPKASSSCTAGPRCSGSHPVAAPHGSGAAPLVGQLRAQDG